MDEFRDIVLAENEFIWNTGWDSSKHPRDKKGRFTFVLNLKSLMSTGKFTEEFVDGLRKQIKEYERSSDDAKWQVNGERGEMRYYQDSGYHYINDSLRSGADLEEVFKLGCFLDDACRFSADSEITTYRGEASWSNNWKDVKVGQSMPDGLKKSFISTSLNTEIADKFSGNLRFGDPDGKATIYETTIEFKVKPSQRFGIPQAYSTTVEVVPSRQYTNGMKESEILLPYDTDGKITKFTEATTKRGNRTIVEQKVEITIGE